MLYMLVQRGGSGKSSKKVPAPNSASSGSKVLGCVELVCSAFSEGAELTTKLSRRQRTRREHEYHHEIQLQSVLAQGKRQIQAHYKEGFARFGEAFLVGDGKWKQFIILSLFARLTIEQMPHAIVCCASPSRCIRRSTRACRMLYITTRSNWTSSNCTAKSLLAAMMS